MKILNSNYDLLFPMDVDKKRIVLAVMDMQRVIQKVSIPYNPVCLLNYVRNSFAGQKGLFAYEAGPTGYGIYDFLTEKGEDCVLAVPSMIPQAPGKRVKTNRLDAVNLGVQLRTNELKLVKVPEKKYRDLRHLTRLRVKYGKRVVGTKNALKGLYLFEGIEFPEGRWTRGLISELKKINYRSAVEFKVKQLLKDLEYFHREELKVKLEIRRYCLKDKEIRGCIGYLMSMPGVGWTVSSYILGALGGYKQLETVRKTSGFLGLGPRENSTGEKVRKGQITAVGDPVARKMIIQSSWVAIRKDLELNFVYYEICGRNPERYRKQKAIVAVARKLVCRIHAVLREQRCFEKRLKRKAA